MQLHAGAPQTVHVAAVRQLLPHQHPGRHPHTTGGRLFPTRRKGLDAGWIAAPVEQPASTAGVEQSPVFCTPDGRLAVAAVGDQLHVWRTCNGQLKVSSRCWVLRATEGDGTCCPVLPAEYGDVHALLWRTAFQVPVPMDSCRLCLCCGWLCKRSTQP